MTDLLNDPLTEHLRSFRHATTPVVLFTGASLDAGRRVGPARLLANELGSRIACVVDDRSTVKSTAELASWVGLAPVPVSSDVDVDPAVEEVAVAVAVDVPPTATLLRRHVDLLRSFADRGATIFTGHSLGRAHDNIIDVRRIGVSDRTRFTNADRHSHRVMVYEATDRSPELSSHPATTDASLALCRALQEAGVVADWLPSSPTGLLLRGFGRCLDHAGLDQAGGVVEGLLQIIEPQADAIVVEGSGSLNDPSTSSRSIAQANVVQPSSYVIAHRASPRKAEDHDDFVADVLAPLRRRIDHLHGLAGRRSVLLGVALECSELSTWEARSLIAEVESAGIACLNIAEGLGRFARVVAALEGAT